jgi:hypothetical protein
MHRLLVLVSLVGCQPAPPEAPSEPAPASAAAAPDKRPVLATTAEVGALDPYATDVVFRRLEPEVSRCLAQGARRVEGLGGEFTVSLRIGAEGEVAAAFMAASTLGSRETERCILEAARSIRWPRPLGGIAEAEHTFSVEASVEVHEWDAAQLRPVLLKMRQQLARCVPRVGPPYQATMYLRRDGRVVSAGVAPPNPAAEEQSDCVADVLGALRFGPQRGRLTKVSFMFR